MYKIIVICLIFFMLIPNGYSLSMIPALFSGIGSFFSGSTDKASRNYNLQSIYFSTSTDSNDGVATKLHLVIIYDEELASDLFKRTAREYFGMVKDLKRDYVGKIAILEWEIPAENRISRPISLQNTLKKAKPKLMLIFANMRNKNDSQRYPVPEDAKNLKITIDAKELVLGNTSQSRSKRRNNTNRSNNKRNNKQNLFKKMNINKAQNEDSMNNSHQLGYFSRASNFVNDTSNGENDSTNY